MSISSWAIVNGVAMPLEQAQIPVTDPAVTIGWSVFETLRSDDSGTPRRLPQHLARLKRSCQTATIEMQDESHISAEVLQDHPVRQWVSSGGRPNVRPRTIRSAGPSGPWDLARRAIPGWLGQAQ